MKPRELLTQVYENHGRDALDALLDQRALSRGRTIDEKLARLARSYRGDVGALIHDLRVRELRTLAGLIFDIDGESYVLSRRRGRSRDELVEVLEAALASGVVHPDLDRVPPELIETPEHRSEPRAIGRATRGGDEALGRPRDPFPRVRGSWSGPRQIARVMKRLRLDVPERLRTPRFQQLVIVARAAGFEMRLKDDDRVLQGTDETPGIHARVRLRRIGGGPREHHSDRAAAVETVVVPASRPIADPVRNASASAYELALMRLELLTAVPSLQREHRPEWPRAFVDAATRRLALEPHHGQVLTAVAQNFRRGFHDFTGVAERLRHRLPEAEWNALLADFERLNSDSAAAVQLILRHVRGEDSGAMPKHAPPAVVALPPRQPAPAAARHAAATERGSFETDVRDLGPLEGMFD